jgi:glyoxylase-like metal-dependent hydrolase (beta-lactamase superfamily II)
MSNRILLGGATLTRVVEHHLDVSVDLFPQTPSQAWRDNADLLVPTFFNPDTGQCRVTVQSWIIEVDGLTVVIDTGVGNDRDRPHLPQLDHLSTEFPGALRAAGFDPNDIDVVVNTHLHADHVGWNTQIADGAWVPTFPNARYLIADADYRFFGPDGGGSDAGARIVFSDSVLPVADQTERFTGDYQVSESLWLRPASGHTPGSTVVWLDAGVPAVFVGDLTHCPIQIPRPDDPCAFDVNTEEAAATRKRIFTEASRRRAAVIPAHYPGHGGATIVARGDRFSVDGWLTLDPI